MSKLNEEFLSKERDKIGEEETISQKYMRLVKENIGPGITVALVSIPLSTALAIASGATPIMGLSAAIYGPCISGIIGGSNYNILGPAGALVNIINGLVQENGVKIVPLVALVSGIFIAIVYALKLEKFCTLIPLSVLEGFSLGVAITIGCGQLNSAFGLKNLTKHKEFYQNLFETLQNLGSTDIIEFTPFFIFFVTLMALSKYFPGKPWIILIAILGIFYGFIMTKYVSSFKPTLLLDKYPEMGLSISIVDFSYFNNQIPLSNIIIGGLKVSFVAVLETLISARIADNLTGTRFDQSMEVKGLAVSNLVCGLLGATPCTGVLVRTAVNVSSGATFKISQFINGIIVLVVIFLLLPCFTYIPMPVIASILITSACRLVPKKIIAHLFHLDKFECFILLFTAGLCVFVDGAFGLLIGGMVTLLMNASKNPLQKVVKQEDQKSLNNDENVFTVQGTLTYLNCVQFEVEVIEQLTNKPEILIIELQNLLLIDVDAVESLQIVFKQAKDKRINIALVVSNYSYLPQEGETMNSILKNSPFYKQALKDNIVFDSKDQAQQFLKKYQ